MIKKLFNAQLHSITSAAIVIGSASLLSRIMGVFRDRVLAGAFGAGEVLDIYYASFRIPDLIFQLLVAGAISAGFIPLFVQRYQISKEKAYNFSYSVLFLILLSIVGLSVLGIILAPYIIPLLVPGFGGQMLPKTIMVTRIMFLSPIFLGISSVFGGILQAQKRFFPVAIAPIFYNAGIIIGAVVFSPIWGVIGLALGVVLGAFLHAISQLPILFSLGFWPKIPKNIFTPGIQELFKLMVPRVLTLGIVQVNLLVINIIASTIAVGSLAIFNWALNLQSFPLGVFGVSFAIAAFPTLSELAAKKDIQSFVHQFSRTARQILFFLIPFTILFIILRAQIVRVVLGAGMFDWTATILTMNTLAFLVLGLTAQGLVFLLARAFYAFSETKTPFYCALTAAALHLFFALQLSGVYGIWGLGLAFSLANIVQCLLLWFFLRKKIGSLNEKAIIIQLCKLIAPSIALTFVTQTIKTTIGIWLGTDTFVKVFFQGVFAGMSGIFVFGLVGYFMHLDELLVFFASLKKKFLRISAPLDIDQSS